VNSVLIKPLPYDRPDELVYMYGSFSQNDRASVSPPVYRPKLRIRTKPGVADYLPAPYGLPGFANPVEQVYPAMVPFLELADGRVITAADGADEILPGVDGKSLRVVWRRWALLGGKSGQLVDPHITSEVYWHLSGTTLTRKETLKSSEPLTIHRWWLAVPSTAALNEWSVAGSRPLAKFIVDHDQASLSVTALADWPLKISLLATGDNAGALREFEATLTVEPDRFRALAGAMRAATAMGDSARARRHAQQLARVAERGDTPGRADLALARRLVSH